MHSFSFSKALVAVSMFAFVPLACGDDESNPKPAPSDGGESNAGGSSPGRTDSGGSGGSGGDPMVPLPPGISDTESTIECAESCDSARVGALGQFVYIDPCCAGAEEACGLNTQFLDLTGASFTESCQPKNQPGELDESCSATEPGSIPFNGQMVPLSPFPGCCRPNGTCGVQVNQVVVMLGPQAATVGNLELGCVDAAPFFDADADPVPCGEGVGGHGNAGAGGAPPTVGGAGAGGASGAGGAGGNE